MDEYVLVIADGNGVTLRIEDSACLSSSGSGERQREAPKLIHRHKNLPEQKAAPPDDCLPVHWDRDGCSACWDEEEQLSFTPNFYNFLPELGAARPLRGMLNIVQGVFDAVSNVSLFKVFKDVGHWNKIGCIHTP